jgi:hypothetical protein
VKNAFCDKFVNGGARLERWVELDQRFRPQDPGLQLLIHEGMQPGLTDLDEAAGIGRVFLNHLLAERKDIHDEAPSPGRLAFPEDSMVPTFLAGLSIEQAHASGSGFFRGFADRQRPDDRHNCIFPRWPQFLMRGPEWHRVYAVRSGSLAVPLLKDALRDISFRTVAEALLLAEGKWNPDPNPPDIFPLPENS